MAIDPLSIRSENSFGLYSPVAARPAPTLPVEFVSPAASTTSLPKNVSLRASHGDKTHAAASEVLQPSSADARAQKILDTLLVDTKKQAVPGNHMIDAVQQKFVEFMESQFKKTTEGKAEPSDQDQVFRAKALLELSQTVFQEAARAQAELDKMEQLDAVEVAKQKMELWAWAEKKHIELLKAQEELAALQQRRKMEKEAHDFRHKMEMLKEQAKNAHKDWEYLLKVQELKASGKINSETSAGNLPGSPQTDTLLHQAVRSGDIWMVKIFLHAKFPKNKLDADGNTPLACALKSGKLEIAKLFEPTKKETLFTNKQKQTLLHLAILSGDLECVKWILSKNKDLLEARNAAQQTPLFCAVAANHLHIAKFLAEQGAAVDILDYEGRTLIDCAFDHEDTEIVEWLVDQDPKLLKKEGKDRYPPITHAIRRGDMVLAEKMLEKGTIFDTTNPVNRTLLHEVAGKGFCDCISWLIGKGLSPDVLDSTGSTPLLTALLSGQTKAIKRLLSHGAKTDYLGRVFFLDGWSFWPKTLAQAAIYSQHPIEVLAAVIQTKEDLLTPDFLDFIPLQIAVVNGFLPVAKYLQQHEFHQNPESQRLKTLLPLAVESGSLEMVKWVYSIIPKEAEYVHPGLNAAIELDELEIAKWLQETSGLSLDSSCLLDWAPRGKNGEMLDWILTFDAVNINYSDTLKNPGLTPFLIACSFQNLEGAVLLVARGASAKVSDIQGNTAWHTIFIQATPSPSIKWVQKLNAWLGNKSVNTKNNEGIYPIHCAAAKGCEKFAQTMETEANAETNTTDNESRTLLHHAVLSGRVETVQYAHAKCKNKLNAKMKGNLTAFELALEKRHFTIANFLFAQEAAWPGSFNNNVAAYLFYAAKENVSRVVEKIGSEYKDHYSSTPWFTFFKVAVFHEHYELAVKKVPQNENTLDLVFEIINKAKNPVNALKFLYTHLKCPIRLESQSPPRNALNEAVQKNQRATGEFLLTKQVTVEKEGGLFNAAVHSGSWEMLAWSYLRSNHNSLSGTSSIEHNQITGAKWCIEHQIPFPSNALHLWAQHNGSKDLLQLLIDQGFELEGRNELGKTPAYVAIWHQHRSAVEQLILLKISLKFSEAEKRELLEAILFNPKFSPDFLDWILTHIDCSLKDKDKEDFTLLEGALFMGAARAASYLFEKGVEASLTRFRKETVSQYQLETKNKYPKVELSPHESLENLLNCACYLEKKLRSYRIQEQFSINNPIHRMLLPIAFIHDYSEIRTALDCSHISSAVSALRDSAVLYTFLCQTYNLYPRFLIQEMKMPEKVLLPGNYSLKGGYTWHLITMADDESLQKSEDSLFSRISNVSYLKSLVDSSAVLLKDDKRVEELTAFEFVVLNPFKLKHALPIAKKLHALGVNLSQQKDRLRTLARMSDDAAMIQWVNSLRL